MRANLAEQTHRIIFNTLIFNMINPSNSPAYHLIVPNLLSHCPHSSTVTAPVLARLLSRADQIAGPIDYPTTLFQLFGQSIPTDQQIPSAALSYHATPMGQAQPLPNTCLLHADPIHLRPDQDRLLACDLYHQPLTLAEATQYATLFNQYFADTQIQLIIAEPHAWYLAVPEPPAIQTHPLSEVIGRNIDTFLPTGPDASRWRAYLNEIQMLWHTAEPNRQREAAGQLTVNGLWLSGAGLLPAPVPQRITQVMGDCLLLQGLAQHTTSIVDQQNIITVQVEHAPGRAILDADPIARQTALQQLDRQLSRLLDQELYLYPCAGHCWHWRPSMRYHWWRRTKPLAYWTT